MKKTKRGLSDTALCALGVSVLGLFAAAALLAAVAAKKRCSGNYKRISEEKAGRYLKKGEIT